MSEPQNGLKVGMRARIITTTGVFEGEGTLIRCLNEINPGEAEIEWWMVMIDGKPRSVTRMISQEQICE